MLRNKRLLAVLLFLGGLLAAVEFSGLRGHLNLAFLQHQILENEITGLAIFVLLFSLGNLIQIPGWLFLAARIFRRLDARPVESIFLLRVLFQTVPALKYALAMSGVRFRQYLAGTLLGLPLPIALYCLFFEYLAKILGIA